MARWVSTKIDDEPAFVDRHAIVAAVQADEGYTKLLLVGGHSVLAEGKLSDFVVKGTAGTIPMPR
jgi:hypothetical protein